MSAAVKHVLQLMQKDSRLAYLIGPGSRSHELLTQEAAQAAGHDVADFRREFDDTLKFERWPSAADIQERIDERDQLIAEMLAALKGVVRVADRATDEFDAARAAIAKAAQVPA